MALPLLLLFVVVPIAELYVIIQVGEAIGALPTIAILVADSFLGTWLLRSQGRAASRRPRVLPPADEEVRTGAAGGPGESVSFSWADPGGALCGSARIGIGPGSSPSVSGLALLFRGSEAIALAASPADVRDEVD